MNAGENSAAQSFRHWLSANLWTIVCGAVAFGAGYATINARIAVIEAQQAVTRIAISELERGSDATTIKLERIDANVAFLAERAREDREGRRR